MKSVTTKKEFKVDGVSVVLEEKLTHNSFVKHGTRFSNKTVKYTVYASTETRSLQEKINKEVYRRLKEKNPHRDHFVVFNFNEQ